MARVVVWRTGVVAVLPNRGRIEGGLVVCQGEARRLKRAVEVVARHAYDGRTLLVPGVPEASSDCAAYAAAQAFREQVLKRYPQAAGGLL